MSKLYAGVETGGTKFVAGVGSAAGGSRITRRIETRDPDATFADIAAFFAENAPTDGYAGVGIASFGPVDLDRSSQSYGHILETPKIAWRGADLVGRMATVIDAPIAIDTDVNAAALAEARLGAGRGRSDDLAYVTIGTGIGVGLVIGGRTVHGSLHPEAGHIFVRRHKSLGEFKGVCPSHGDCLEGIAAGPAIAARWGAGLDTLPPDHPAWAAEAEHIAQLCAMLLLTTSPATIVLGGGVMSQPALFPPIRKRTAALIADYVRDADEAALAQRIVPPACAEAPGLLGAYLLAEQAD
ncbi:fructokinase [Sphingomonas vulcanisoli]|uniref:fructokinase n=1 Tax=Sphingomonas vulcanisoli TaxID=1658060 RepID=A0ABX0TTU4_9SPHN|nr:ROK family protein [Sphingomonas vulcanisoli]NIJ08938.1 fructokinase [Sphingomonas vulcanisoli]